MQSSNANTSFPGGRAGKGADQAINGARATTSRGDFVLSTERPSVTVSARQTEQPTATAATQPVSSAVFVSGSQFMAHVLHHFGKSALQHLDSCTAHLSQCNGGTSEGCGVHAYNPSDASTMHTQCPNLRGHALERKGSYPYPWPTCCQDDKMSSSSSSSVTRTPSAPSADTVLDMLLSAAGFDPQTHSTVAITVCADSTSPYGQLRDKLCSGSSRWKCVTDASISLPGARTMARDAPIASVHWPSNESATTLAGCPGLGADPAKPWWVGLLNAPNTVEAVKMVDPSRNATLFFQSYSLRSIVNPAFSGLVHYTLGEPLGWHNINNESARLECAALVLDKLAECSDVVLVNIGHHHGTVSDDPQRLRLSIRFALNRFMAALRSPLLRLRRVIPVESVPSHFPSSDGSGIFNRGSGDMWGKCV
jgi:hypothetical protein